MAVQLRSGKEVSSSRSEKKERSKQEDVKETGEEDRNNNLEWTAETENKVYIEQYRKTVSKIRKRRFKPTHLQFLSHKDFRRQRRRNNFLNS